MHTCPACHADLEGTTAAAGDATRCPFCGAELAWPQHQDRAALEESSGDEGETEAADIPPLPPKSRIEVIDATPERLVVHLPPGSESARGLGCFALFWNGFMCLFTPPWFFALAQADGPPLLIIIPFLTLFWGIGLGMAWFWLRMRYTRIYLLLEPERCVLQTQWLGRKRTDDTRLTETSRARLVESFKANDVPVHSVHLSGETRTLKFATHLSEPDKQWLASAINRFLGREPAAMATPPPPRFCQSCGGSLAEVDFETEESNTVPCPHCGVLIPKPTPQVETAHQLPVPRIQPRDVPVESGVVIEEDDGNLLRFSLPFLPRGPVRTWVSAIPTLIGSVWALVAAGGIWQAAWQPMGGPPGAQLFRLIDVLVGVLFLAPAMFLLLLGQFLRWGRISISVDRDRLQVRYHYGRIGITSRVASAMIESIRVSTTSELEPTTKAAAASSPPGAEDVAVAVVQSGTKHYPLTTLHERKVSEVVAGLVQTRLETLGVAPRDVVQN